VNVNAEQCRGVESMLQPYLDRALTEKEITTVDVHLQECSYCNDRYVFERNLRATVKTCCCEEHAPEGFVDRLRLRCSGHDE
jgi:anti-sigma factor (TIGR02949 family)